MKLNKITKFAILASLFSLAGCAPPYRQKFWDEGAEKSWTEKQKLAAFAYADRIFWAQSKGENQFVIVYGRVPVAKIREQLDKVQEDLKQILDPKSDDNRKYIETFGLRKDLEHEEEVTGATYARIRAAELDTQFKQDMGQVPTSGPEADLAGGYNLRKIFMEQDVAKAFPFTSEQIEGAKKDGTLKAIETAEFDINRTYDRKETDPLHMDDPNEFVWKSSKRSIRLVNYKIVTADKPQNNNGDYIEGTVANDGVPESKPRLKIFFPPSGYLAVVLIDTDKEGDPGFGIPDVLEQMGGIGSVQDVIRQGNLLDTLFKPKPKEERADYPQAKLFKIEIAKVGQPIDPWQKSPDANGWIVPFKYQTTRGDNFNVRIKFQKPVIDPANPEAAHNTDYLKIDYIEKEYTTAGQRYQASQGAVTEYYRPKGDFAGLVKAQVVFNEDTKKLDFVFPDGSEITGYVTPGQNKFIEEKPYAKAFNEGGKRYWIEKSEDSGTYDKRRTVTAPKEQVGQYQDDNQTTQQNTDQNTDQTMDQ